MWCMTLTARCWDWSCDGPDPSAVFYFCFLFCFFAVLSMVGKNEMLRFCRTVEGVSRALFLFFMFRPTRVCI